MGTRKLQEAKICQVKRRFERDLELHKGQNSSWNSNGVSSTDNGDSEGTVCN